MLLQMNTELLKQKADMIEEYFCIHIDKDGNLSRLPVILDQYTPDMDRVPEFVLCLGNDVSSFLFSWLSRFSHIYNHIGLCGDSDALYFGRQQQYTLLMKNIPIKFKTDWR